MNDLTKTKESETPDFVCPHCGMKWDETGEYWRDEEYGYFTLDEGKSMAFFTCAHYRSTLNGRKLVHGCGNRFKVARTVETTVSYGVADKMDTDKVT